MRPLHLTPASEATRLAVQDNAPRSARDPNFKQFVKRVPELKLAAQQLMAGELSKEQYGHLVAQYRPVSEYTRVPMPATDADLRQALNSKQMEKIGAPAATLATGDRVGLRLDIPAYERHGVWAVSVHEQQAGFAAGKVIGYDSVAAVTNATLGVVQKAALKIAAGTSKSTIAVIKGNWLPLSSEEAVEAANSALTDPTWRQVGMHPERHAYFFDRGNLRPVTAAETVIQVGPLVLAKNVTYGSMDDVLFSRAVGMIEVGGAQRPIVTLQQRDEVRRSPADRPLGNARPVDPHLLDQRVPPAIEAILRSGRKSGATTINGLSVLRQAMREIGATGPLEARPLAAMVKQLLPVEGTVLLTVDDRSVPDLHGALAIDPVLHLTLFTAPPRAGLSYSTLFHECLHVCVGARYRSLAAALRHGGETVSPAAAETLAQFHSIWTEFCSVSAADGIENPGLRLAVNEARSSPDEFFVRSLTDPMLQSYLAAKRYEGRTLWQKFTGWVKSSLFGVDDARAAPSWLDAALGASDGLANGLFRHGSNDMAHEDEQGADDEEAERDCPRG